MYSLETQKMKKIHIKTLSARELVVILIYNSAGIISVQCLIQL